MGMKGRGRARYLLVPFDRFDFKPQKVVPQTGDESALALQGQETPLFGLLLGQAALTSPNATAVGASHPWCLAGPDASSRASLCSVEPTSDALLRSISPTRAPLRSLNRCISMIHGILLSLTTCRADDE